MERYPLDCLVHPPRGIHLMVFIKHFRPSKRAVDIFFSLALDLQFF